jgi:hypothetical protein
MQNKHNFASQIAYIWNVVMRYLLRRPRAHSSHFSTVI